MGSLATRTTRLPRSPYVRVYSASSAATITDTWKTTQCLHLSAGAAHLPVPAANLKEDVSCWRKAPATLVSRAAVGVAAMLALWSGPCTAPLAAASDALRKAAPA